MGSELLTATIIGAAIEVHRHLGPGLMESTYEACLAYEISQKDLKVESQQLVPIMYKGVKLEREYRLDLIVEDQVIIEIKSVRDLAPVHEAQLLSYLKLRGGGVGLLINFNVALLRDGIRRLIV
ncbi:MAG: GxxExxY protein [Chlamydiales bacterium]|nr:GxxExxY protein [Chlamydiales bacterium]